MCASTPRAPLTVRICTELDALALEEEEEGPSYLADLNKMPDFVDEAPIETGQVSVFLPFGLVLC